MTQKLKTQAPAPGGRRRRWLLIGLGVLAAGAGALVWLIWPFWQLAAQFGNNPVKQPSRLYGRPPELRVGDGLDPEALAERLEDAGYVRAAEGEMGIGTFRLGDGEVEIFRRRFPTPRGTAGGDRLRLTLDGGRIAALARVGPGEAREIDAAYLDPPLIASYYGPDLKERRPVTIEEIPEDLVLSVLAAEDDSFLEHGGVSVRAILRAAWVNLTSRELRQGGSTLTQQLVKNLYLTHERTLARKLQEVVLAILIDARYEKRAILQAYLNEIYWGRSGSVNLMGIGAAAWGYFGKDPAQLTLAESALLAGMIQAPAHLSPRRHPEAARQRRDVVLGRLVQLRWVTEARATRASKSPVRLHRDPAVARRAPYFAAFADEEAQRRFGLLDLADAGYVLCSTLDLDDQETAEETVDWGVEALESGWEKGREVEAPLEVALVSLDPRDGAIRAYVGGRDFARSQFDRVSLARRQAGSAFKPIVYAAAFEQRLASPAYLLEDSPYTVVLAGQPWSPQNSNGQYQGWVTARTALEQSLNVPTARLAGQVGLDSVVAVAGRLGVATHLEPFPALALGAMEITPLELATVYATLANAGARPTPHGLAAVFDRAGDPVAGQPIPEPPQVLSEEVAFLVNNILQGVLERGTAASVREQGITDRLAGKTGTTNSRRDSWFAGYSPERATLVWVGYDDNSKTRLSGARAALPIWARFTHKVRPPGGYSTFRQPPGVVAAWIDSTTGGLATDQCPEVREEYFLRDHVPQELCPDHYGWRAEPLDQPDGIEPPKKENRFKRWLRMLRGKDRT